MRPLLSRPGKGVSRELRKPTKPKEKKFEELPGPEKVSRGSWNCLPPIETWISESNSWEIRRGRL